MAGCTPQTNSGARDGRPVVVALGALGIEALTTCGQLGQRHLSSHGLVDVAHIMAHGASGGGKGGTGGRGGSEGGDGGKNGGAGGGEHASQPPQMPQLHLLVHGLVDLSQKSVHGGGGGGGARGDSMYNRLANARTQCRMIMWLRAILVQCVKVLT